MWESILTIVASGVLAAIVSGFLSVYLQKIQYRNDYYKLIIGKRLEAYELLDKALYATILTYDHKDGKYYEFMLTYNRYKEFYDKFIPILNYSRMYSDKTWNVLTSFKKQIFEYNNKIYQAFLEEEGPFDMGDYWTGEPGTTGHIHLASSHFNQIERILGNLHNSIYNDMLELHKIGKIKKKSNNQ